jgi:hypothetical protein
VDLVARTVFPADLALACVWSRERCTWRHHPGTREEHLLRESRKVARPGCDLDRVLMVDDESHKLEKPRQPHPHRALHRRKRRH